MSGEGKGKKTGWEQGIIGAVCIVLAVVLIAAGVRQVEFSYEQGQGMAFAAEAGSEAPSENKNSGTIGLADESGSESGSDLESELLSETESESESERESESGMESELTSESMAGTESELTSDSMTGMESELTSESAAGVESELTSESAAGVESELTSESAAGVESELTSESMVGVESELTSESMAGVESELTSESAAEVESELISENMTGMESEENAVESEEESDTETEVIAELDTETEAELITESGTEGTTEIASERMTEAVIESEGETIDKKPELSPEKISRGKHYEVRGDQGAWYRDGNDRLWIRKGTNLYIETKNESGFDSLGLGKENLQTDGELTFQLQKTDSAGQVLAISEVRQELFYIDGEAPTGAVIVSGNLVNGVVYAAQAAEAVIQIPPDGKSGLKKAEYCIVNCRMDGTITREPTEAMWLTCENGQQVQVRAEGIFRIYVRTQDQVGNQGFSQSEILCVDQTPPELTVDGIIDQTANSDTVKIQVSCKDQHYKQGSMMIQILGVNTGKSPALQESGEAASGAFVKYFDIPHTKAFDDIYELHITAMDLSGNQSQKELKFSVNRFGSVYDLSDDTKKGLEQYYLNQAQSVTFYETNIDYVGESEIFCRRDGELFQLKRGKDYQVSMQGSSDSWKQYQYTVPVEYFGREGIYELLLSSRDLAENQSDTGMQEKRVVFVLDWSSPGCIITGVESGQIYDKEQITACLVPEDNFNIAKMKVFADSELLMEREAEPGQTIKLTFEAADQWRTLQVYLCDQAGNEYWSEEIPFFVRNSPKEVQPYEKLRESAEEMEKRKKLEESELLGGFSFTLQRKETQAVSMEKAASVSEATEKESAAQKKVINSQEGKSIRGSVLLFVGAAAFFATVMGFLVTGFTRKK